MLKKNNYTYLAKQLEKRARVKPNDKADAEAEAISYMNFQTELIRCRYGFCDHSNSTYRQCKKAVINKFDLAPAVLSSFNNRYIDNRIHQAINKRLLQEGIIDSSESALMDMDTLKAFIKEKTSRNTQKAEKIDRIITEVREEINRDER